MCKITYLKTAYGQNSYSDTSLSLLRKALQDMLPQANTREYRLQEHLHSLPTSKSLHQPDEELERIGAELFSSDLLVIATPVYNFTYSPYLQVLFHKLRRHFLTLDEQSGALTPNKMRGRKAFFVITGRGSKRKWLFLTQFIVKAQLSLLFRFWGARVIGYTFIDSCHPGHLPRKQKTLEEKMNKAARFLSRKITRFAPEARRKVAFSQI